MKVGDKLNIVIAVAVGLIVIAGLAHGLYNHFTKGPTDYGLMERRGTESTVELKPKILPQAVLTNSDLVFKHIPWAVEWWNQKTDKRTLFIVGGKADPGLWERSKREKLGTVYIEIASIDAELGGHANPVYDKANGEIWYTHIVINYDHAYDVKTLRASMLHELGHALGLEDDPHSLDRGGIMDQKAAIIGISEPTKHDISIIGGL